LLWSRHLCRNPLLPPWGLRLARPLLETVPRKGASPLRLPPRALAESAAWRWLRSCVARCPLARQVKQPRQALAGRPAAGEARNPLMEALPMVALAPRR
ncbi:MAG: hypothetical protein ACREFN_13925, partial [Acetobacteraceae bacterium]